MRRSRLEQLRPGDVRPGGTNLGAALEAAIDVFGTDEQQGVGGRTIVLFSDGEDHDGRWDQVIERLARARVIVHALSIGDDRQGHPVPVEPAGTPLSYQGALVESRRHDRALSAIAGATGGAFIPLGLASADLGKLYLDRIEPVARRKRESLSRQAHERRERHGLPILAALGLGVAACYPWPRSRSRRRSVIRYSRGVLLLLGMSSLPLILGAGNLEPESRISAIDHVEAGRAAYRAGRWADALAEFNKAQTIEPGTSIVHFDRGAALYQLERYDEALEAYLAARRLASSALGIKIDYALGNTALAQGDLSASIAFYDACVATHVGGSDLDAVRRDASINRRFALELRRKNPSPAPKGQAPPSPPDRPRGRDDATGDQDTEASNSGKAERSVQQGPSGSKGQAAGNRLPDREVGSPEEQLEAAVERIRAARHRRLDETTPGSVVDRKDW